ncbi:MAG: hypothetical protein WBD63_11835 [Phycisphaerae bacterium]|nr:hypothetical protein [Phycisphaerae bacterium]
MKSAAETFLAISPRGEGWVWWLSLVTVLVLVGLLVAVLRRRLLHPMTHEPSDTSDAWTEAGRRIPLKPADKDSEDGDAE